MFALMVHYTFIGLCLGLLYYINAQNKGESNQFFCHFYLLCHIFNISVLQYYHSLMLWQTTTIIAFSADQGECKFYSLLLFFLLHLHSSKCFKLARNSIITYQSWASGLLEVQLMNFFNFMLCLKSCTLIFKNSSSRDSNDCVYVLVQN